MSDLPLAGCRVLDLGIITAGAATSALLADLGATVIKVESESYKDPFRQWAPNASEGTPGASPYFRASNRNKQSASIDLKQARGRDVFLKLVRDADVVVENFRRGVLDRLGLGYAALCQANPQIILASISSQGEDGPLAGHVSFGSTLDAMSGLAWLSGEGTTPVISGQDLNYPDQVVAIFAASMVATAWRERLLGRGGQHLDISQRELTSYLCGEAFIAGDAMQRMGNADPDMAVQGCFATRDDHWLAVSVPPELYEVAETLAASETIDGQLEDRLRHWIGGQDAQPLLALLLGHGVPAAIVKDGGQVLAAERWQCAMQRDEAGALVKGVPFRFASHPMTIPGEAPSLGRDTRPVLLAAGFSETEIDALIAEGAVAAG